MGERELRTLFEGGDFFEGPRFQAGLWWLSDFYRHVVVTIGDEGREDVVMEVEGQPSGLGWLPDGSMLVVSMKDHRLLRRYADGHVDEHANLSGQAAGHLNDLVVDSQGRAYVGDFGFNLMAGVDPVKTTLKRVDLDGTITVVADELAFPNGMVITPDGMSLIVGETFAGRYTAFAVAADGSLEDRRVWAQVTPEPPAGTTLAEFLAAGGFAPDGCCLDREGHIWSADAEGQRCVRLAPGGDIVEEIRMPDGLGCFACMLGGADGRTLLMCAAPDFGEHTRAGQRGGVLFTTNVDAPHAGLP
jgi:sugar lactone lactonase YvrE